MIVFMLDVGKNSTIAQEKINAKIKSLSAEGYVVKDVRPDGMRVLIITEKNVAKELTGNPDNGSVKERKGKTKEVTSETQDTTNNGTGSKPPKRTRKSRKS